MLGNSDVKWCLRYVMLRFVAVPYKLFGYTLSIFLLSGENSFHHQVQDIQTEYVRYQPTYMSCNVLAVHRRMSALLLELNFGYFLHTVVDSENIQHMETWSDIRYD
jgi:hypothetical protein